MSNLKYSYREKVEWWLQMAGGKKQELFLWTLSCSFIRWESSGNLLMMNSVFRNGWTGPFHAFLSQ